MAFVVFKGGSMDGTEIAYQNGFFPADNDEIVIRKLVYGNSGSGSSLNYEVYRFIRKLESWVYDHESEVVDCEE